MCVRCIVLVMCRCCVIDATFLTVQTACHPPSSRCATPGDFKRQAEQHKSGVSITWPTAPPPDILGFDHALIKRPASEAAGPHQRPRRHYTTANAV